MSSFWKTISFGGRPRFSQSRIRDTELGPIRPLLKPAHLELGVETKFKSRVAPGFSDAVIPFSAAIKSFAPAAKWDLMKEKHIEDVIGIDDRQPVVSTGAWPFCALGGLTMQFPDGQGSGSASLIDEAFIITAGHCVYLKEYGGWIKGAKFAPAAIGGRQPFGLATALACWVPTEWVESEDNNYDFALIAIDRTFTNQCGYMGIAAYDSATLAKSRILVSGYPTDKGGLDPYYAVDGIIAVDQYRLHYLLSSYRGQSGAAALLDQNESFNFAVGVHTFGSANENSGLRITGSVLSGIDDVLSGKIEI